MGGGVVHLNLIWPWSIRFSKLQLTYPVLIVLPLTLGTIIRHRKLVKSDFNVSTVNEGLGKHKWG